MSLRTFTVSRDKKESVALLGISERAFQLTVFETGFLAALIAIAVVLLRGRVRWAWLGGVIALAFANKIILWLGVDGGFGDWIGGRFNWEGKFVATALLMITTLLVFKETARERVGLTLSQNGPAKTVGLGLAVFTLLATAAFQYFYFPGVNEAPLADQLYQLTMPSLHEELWFRGLMLAMLIAAFTPKGSERASAKIVFLAAAVVTVQFWAVHSIGTDGEWGFVFRAWYNPASLIYGALWMGVRLGTRSLLLPILLHSWTNTAGYLF